MSKMQKVYNRLAVDMTRGIKRQEDSRSLKFSRKGWHHWCIGSRTSADSKNQRSSLTHTIKLCWEKKPKKHTKESCTERNIRGKLKPWLWTTSKSRSSQHYNGKAVKSNCLKKFLRRFLLPRSNHSVLPECLNSTGLRDAAVTDSAEISLHLELIWQTVLFTPDSTHTSSGSSRRWYHTMTEYVPIANKEVAAVQEDDQWWRGKHSFALKYYS